MRHDIKWQNEGTQLPSYGYSDILRNIIVLIVTKNFRFSARNEYDGSATKFFVENAFTGCMIISFLSLGQRSTVWYVIGTIKRQDNLSLLESLREKEGCPPNESLVFL